MSTVLVIDDDPRVVGIVSRALAADGHATRGTMEGGDGVRMARSGRFELVLLDLPMPGFDGTRVLERTMAERPNQPVFVLSERSDVDTKVRCFALGAVDYLTKPFAVDELRARVKARTNGATPPKGRLNGNGHANRNGRLNGKGHGRVNGAGPQNGNGTATVPEADLRAGGIVLDLERRTADSGAGPVQMSNREFLLLRHLMRRPGEVCTREEILEDVWGLWFDPGSNVVDVQVSRLRAKLGAFAIETVRNGGYALST